MTRWSGRQKKNAHFSIMYITFCIITMFIGFLFSQWQRSHLPTAALQSSSDISCETLGTAQSCRLLPSTSSSLREPIRATLSTTVLDLFCFFLFASIWPGVGKSHLNVCQVVLHHAAHVLMGWIFSTLWFVAFVFLADTCNNRLARPQEHNPL